MFGLPSLSNTGSLFSLPIFSFAVCTNSSLASAVSKLYFSGTAWPGSVGRFPCVPGGLTIMLSTSLLYWSNKPSFFKAVLKFLYLSKDIDLRFISSIIVLSSINS